MRLGPGSGKTFKIFVPGEHRETPKFYKDERIEWKDDEVDKFRLGWSDDPFRYVEEGTSSSFFWTAFEHYVLENITEITHYEKGDREKIVRAIFEARPE